ncbi:hypothetical protein NKI25_20730 [Mesorhizobium sp. M0808]|uniref:hypothetical protein n=1 Tax=Mesorhizobium sp. M0808 TaxID=2957002 RepID=UPI00333A54D6
MRLPDLAWKFFNQPAQIVRQALTFEQQKSGGIGHIGSPQTMIPKVVPVFGKDHGQNEKCSDGM